MAKSDWGFALASFHLSPPPNHYMLTSFCFIKALAEELHERVRKEFWGYTNEERLEAKDMHMIKYQVGESRVQLDFQYDHES